MRKLIAALMLLVLASCSWEGSGEIVGRAYDDPDEWYVPDMVIPGTTTCHVDSYGYTQCTSTPPIIIPGGWRYDGPHWFLKIRDSEDGKTHTVEVDEYVYNRCEDGMWFTTESDYCE